MTAALFSRLQNDNGRQYFYDLRTPPVVIVKAKSRYTLLDATRQYISGQGAPIPSSQLSTYFGKQ